MESNGDRVISQKSKRLASAYWECLEVAKGHIIAPFGPDNNSVPELLAQLLKKIKESYDMVIVSHILKGCNGSSGDHGKTASKPLSNVV